MGAQLQDDQKRAERARGEETRARGELSTLIKEETRSKVWTSLFFMALFFFFFFSFRSFFLSFFLLFISPFLVAAEVLGNGSVEEREQQQKQGKRGAKRKG